MNEEIKEPAEVPVPKRKQTPQEELMQRLDLGIDAEVFLSQKLGRYMAERGAMDREEWVEKLIKTNPLNVEECNEIRAQILAVDKFFNYLSEVIQSGEIARLNLEEMQALDGEAQ